MSVHSLLHLLFLLIMTFNKNSKILSIRIGIISGCERRIELDRLSVALTSLTRHHKTTTDLDLIDLSPHNSDVCENDSQFALIFNSIIDSDLKAIVAHIDHKYCELTRLLTILFKKYVLTWNCEALLTSNSDYSQYFLRIGKVYRNGIILLSELMFQMKWKSTIMFVMSNNTVVKDNASALTLISGIKKFLHQSHIEMREAFVIDDRPLSQSVRSAFSKAMTEDIKCEYRSTESKLNAIADKHILFLICLNNSYPKRASNVCRPLLSALN